LLSEFSDKLLDEFSIFLANALDDTGLRKDRSPWYFGIAVGLV
jgi:hypothetical protein